MRIPLRGDRSHEARPERFGRSLAPSPREIYPPTICVASGDWIGFVSSEKVLVLQPTMTVKRRETTGWERNSPGGRQHFPTTQSKRAVQNAPRSNPSKDRMDRLAHERLERKIRTRSFPSPPGRMPRGRSREREGHVDRHVWRVRTTRVLADRTRCVNGCHVGPWSRSSATCGTVLVSRAADKRANERTCTAIKPSKTVRMPRTEAREAPSMTPCVTRPHSKNSSRSHSNIRNSNVLPAAQPCPVW